MIGRLRDAATLDACSTFGNAQHGDISAEFWIISVAYPLCRLHSVVHARSAPHPSGSIVWNGMKSKCNHPQGRTAKPENLEYSKKFKHCIQCIRHCHAFQWIFNEDFSMNLSLLTKAGISNHNLQTDLAKNLNL